MQIDQFLRRILWRARRRVLPGADNEPIVVVEAPGPRPSAPRPRRKWAVTILAFIATFAVFAAGYAFLVAANSRASLDIGLAAPAEAGGSHAVAAATALLSIGAAEPLAVADEGLVLPDARRMRLQRIQAGADETVAAFIAILAQAQSPTDPALSDARDALASNDPPTARDALLRFNVRLSRNRVRAGEAASVSAALARAAASACEAEEAALRQFADTDRGWMATPAAQARFSQARGVAYGWLLILRGALADAPNVAQATVVEAAIPLDALAAAAERQPLFLFNGGVRAPWAPSHLRRLADDFARAAAGARALAGAAERAPGKAS